MLYKRKVPRSLYEPDEIRREMWTDIFTKSINIKQRARTICLTYGPFQIDTFWACLSMLKTINDGVTILM